MNIFFLSLIPTLAAKYHCDKHVVKMVLEAVQILYTAHWIKRDPEVDWVQSAPLNGMNQRGYKKTHPKHPSVLWTVESKGNYVWLCQLTDALNEEFKLRFGKTHSVEPHVQWLKDNIPPYKENEQVFTTPKIAMTPDCKEYAKENNLSPVEAYHHYYVTKKLYFLSYRNLEIPPFLKDHFSEDDNFSRLGLIESSSQNLIKSCLFQQPLTKETKEAYGIDSDIKEKLLLSAVSKKTEPPKKWNECHKNGVRITNAVKRSLGKDIEIKFVTSFDKSRKRKQKTPITIVLSDDEFSDEFSDEVEVPKKKPKLVHE